MSKPKPEDCDHHGAVELPLLDKTDGRCWECGRRLTVTFCGCVRPALPEVRALSDEESAELMRQAEVAAYGAEGRRPRALAVAR